MRDFVQFVQKTVKTVSKISPFPISVSDEKGEIIGDSNAERIGTHHHPTADVLKYDRPQLFEIEVANKMENVLPGVAMPLYFDKETKGSLGIIGDPTEVLPYAKLIKQHVEMMWQDTVRKQIDDLETAVLDAFIQYILFAEMVDQDKIRQYCDMLHINPSLKRYCILIDMKDTIMNRIQQKSHVTATVQFREILLDSVNAAFGKTSNDLSTFLNTEKIILIKSVNSKEESYADLQQFAKKGERLLQQLKAQGVHHVSLAAGGLVRGLDEMSQSFHEAQSLIQYGNKLGIQPEVFSFRQWDVLTAMLPSQIDPQFLAKLHSRLETFLDDKQFNDLAVSFIQYCKNDLNISKTAQELFIHRNTLIYRLKKIEHITGLDLGKFEHCAILWMSCQSLPV